MKNREVLALNVKTLMMHHGIKSQAELSRKTGISQTQIGNIIRNDKAASIDMLERLAIGLNCEPWQLLMPVNLLGDFGQPDLVPLIYCYSRLRLQDQTTVWDITHDLYEAANSFDSTKAELLEHT